MKKITLSLTSVLTLGTFAIAGGDIAPIEPMIETPIVESTSGSFYLGGAYSLLDTKRIDSYTIGTTQYQGATIDTTDPSFMLQAGYNFNPYVAIEGRYWIGDKRGYARDFGGSLNVEYDNKVDSWGIYVKPQYPVTEAFSVYTLLGYASSEYTTSAPDYLIDMGTLDGFSWGIGGKFAYTENISIFADYITLHNNVNDYTKIDRNYGSIDDMINSWNFGVTYTF